jgi:predicted dithiol-disulfide oxidoreductase (DUF899 family)
METYHDKNLPNESEQYRLLRNELLKEEIDLRAQAERVAAMRRELPPGGIIKEDYEFEMIAENGDNLKVRLSELFGSKKSLIIYSFMYGPEAKNPCPMCTSIIGALSGNVTDIEQNASIVVVAKSDIRRIAAFAEQRNWHAVKLASSQYNSYNIDYYAEDEQGNQWPICNVFVKRDNEIYHSYATELLHVKPEEGMNARHVDFMWPLYNYLDITPEGRGDWYPKLAYD